MKYTTTVDQALIRVARVCAGRQGMTLPALIEKLLDAEIKRFVSVMGVIDEVEKLAAEAPVVRRRKGK